MQKHNHIKALFFLGIFSLLLLHQVVPHLHHQHDVEHSHKAVSNSNSDSHSHHHDVPEKESSNKGLLDLFLEVHIHSVVANEIVVTQNSSVKQLKLKKDVKTSIFLNRYSISINYDDEAEKITVYHPPNIYFHQYLSSLDTRGPPSLG
jgi:zinc transporter ZupT